MGNKDYFYIIGIIASVLFSLFNYRISIKNRRNSLREHIYKKQLEVLTELCLKINSLNSEIDKMINNSAMRAKNDYEIKVDAVGKIMFDNQFILANDVITLSNNLITKSTEFYESYLSFEKGKVEIKYKEYFSEFFTLITSIRKDFGIDNLTKENQKIYN
jgi:hypothetical protein